MNAPERIFIRPTHPHKDDLDWYVWSAGTEYIRADLYDAQTAERDSIDAAWSERVALVTAEIADLRRQLAEARRESAIKDCLYDSAFQAGVKLGWNFGVINDEAGFQAATSSTEHIAELKRIRAALQDAAK